MSSAGQLIERIEAAGGVLAIHGDRIRCRLPEEATPLLEELRTRRDEVLLLLRERSAAPTMPLGLRLVQWNLKDPPILIESSAIVTDSEAFARTTLEQLRLALENPKRWVGWSATQLIERLSQVGVLVVLQKEVRTR
jgi:hypothetical protein